MQKNDPSRPVTQFCLAMEEHRRSDAGRVRTAKEFVTAFFQWDAEQATDRIFLRMPREVRGPVLSGWGIRGAKAALKDDDERVRGVVHDALVAGDIDEAMFEQGVTPQIVTDWIALADWWRFWRNGKLTGVAIQKALATARELGLIDDRWFLLNVQGRGGKLKGTDVLCDTLTKDQIVAWVRKIHETGDGAPSGIVAALGWETVLAKTAQDALLFALDEFAKKAGLVEAPPPAKVEERASVEVDFSQPSERLSVEVEVDSEPNTASNGHVLLDSGISVDLPDMPVEERGSEVPSDPEMGRPTATGAEHEPPSIPSVEERSMYASEAESPKLAEARAAMMAMLSQGQSSAEESEPPAKPSSLEWPEPPPPRRLTPTEVHAQPSAKPQPASAPNQPAAGPSGKAPPPPVPRKPPVPPRAR
jgi:hypothetical protein